ncbi:MAG TPA: hypothetical protein VG268_11265 [Streptosporangiaceae bacterium]|nr:hypothetical protein [Streptosporangiaceae bacterium]
MSHAQTPATSGAADVESLPTACHPPPPRWNQAPPASGRPLLAVVAGHGPVASL